jgi:hypothetical protein
MHHWHVEYPGGAPRPVPMAMQSLPLRDQGMEATLRRWTHFLQSAGPNLASVLLILLLAWLLAEHARSRWRALPEGCGRASCPRQRSIYSVARIIARAVSCVKSAIGRILWQQGECKVSSRVGFGEASPPRMILPGGCGAALPHHNHQKKSVRGTASLALPTLH